ncbi:MAG: aminotransferase class I/II-fold pyridoxal phosphate-dependent enzyme [Candidatus Micrarchaeota archaeon]|nr:aminotransferase class I/II-fold pyridoxal phosphate-dependent enzyme [Candidatus Micrarchaeota archaeon]
MPLFNDYIESRRPSAVREAQIEFNKRSDKDQVKVINVSIGNVSLPMHPKMKERMNSLGNSESPFAQGIVEYTPITGFLETKKAFLNVLSASVDHVKDLEVIVTNGGSEAMELVIVATTGVHNGKDRPLLVIDPTYTNYRGFCGRTNRKTVAITRKLNQDGSYSFPKKEEIEGIIKKYEPSAMVIIPYDNPAGHLYTEQQILMLAELAVKYDMWIISDEAYRELYYLDKKPVSVWSITEDQVKGIKGRRISIETASKVWNACGLRIGAIITDNKKLAEKIEYEYSSNLCANAIGQYIFGALAHVSKADLHKWFKQQKDYYKDIIVSFTNQFKKEIPDIIVSSPDASIYSVVDVRNIVDESFDSTDFVLYCASRGKVFFENSYYTLLVTPLSGFYDKNTKPNPGKTQMRISHVRPKEEMLKVPRLFALLLNEYKKHKLSLNR